MKTVLSILILLLMLGGVILMMKKEGKFDWGGIIWEKYYLISYMGLL